MKILHAEMTRRHTLAVTGAVLAAGLAREAGAQAMTPIRQGYQTNMWGMPTYYLLKSGALEKRGIKVEEFAVPSGNLTMQQMVARQVDMGTYAGPSFILGHDKGGLIAIAVIETVGKTIRVMGRKDLGLTKIEDLRGKKVANQTGSSTGNIFVDQLAPAHGLKKGDYQEVRMNVNDMVAAMAAKTVDAMVCVEPYNAIAEADGIGNTIVDFTKVDISAGLARRREGFQGEPREGGGSGVRVLHLQGLRDVEGHVQEGDGNRRGQSRLPLRSAALHAKARRGAAGREEDREDSRLEDRHAAGLPGEGARNGLERRYPPRISQRQWTSPRFSSSSGSMAMPSMRSCSDMRRRTA
jgi:NMT1/THI5 like